MQIVRLELVCSNTFKHEREQYNMVFFGKAWKHPVKLCSVGFAVIGWHPHAEQQYLGTCRLALPYDVVQIGLDHRDGRSAQAVIGAQFKNDDGGMMLAQCLGYALAAAGGCLAADAGVDNLVLRTGALQFLLQQRDPACLAWQPVAGRQAVAEYEDGLLGGVSRLGHADKQANHQGDVTRQPHRAAGL